MLKLRRLRIERFRNLARNAELSFSDGINVLLGQNGTGKTTLLELISMVVRSDFRTLAKEEFAIEYELASSGGASLIVVVRNERVPPSPQQAPVELEVPEVFRPSAEVFNGADRRSLLRWNAEEGLVIGDEAAGPSGLPTPLERSFLFFYVGSVRASAHGDVTRGLRHTIHSHRLDESLNLFGRITGAGNSDERILVDGRSWLINPFAPALVPDDVVESLVTSRESGRPDYSFTHDNLDFLVTLKDMMGFHASELRVDVTEQSPPKQIQIGNLLFRFRWQDGTFITHERLSYGQKRLVCFFYYLACNTDIVIADELVNGLHHRWITASIEAIGQRQAFLTSQNPLLLDYIPITSEENIRRSFVLCRSEPRSGRPGWLWGNMTADDARELFSAYEVGIEHVSEILQSRGLW
jgi:energy-coupling factor transporter ATP-binding protein EcfA2